MPNTYVAPNFDITSSNVTNADLAALKGSAVATTDYIYCSGGYGHIPEGNIAIGGYYFGDNVAGTAAVKSGILTATVAGTTITLHTATLNTGFNGEGALNVITLTGVSGNPVTVTCNTVDKVSNLNCFTSNFILRWCNLTGWYIFYSQHASNVIENCVFDNFQGGLYSTGVFPASLFNLEIKGCGLAMNIVPTTQAHCDGWAALFKNIKLTGNADGVCTFTLCLTRATNSRWMRIKTSSAPIFQENRLGVN